MTVYDLIMFFNDNKKIDVIQLMKLLHKKFKKELPKIHKIRLNALFDASTALIKPNKLTLTALGRGLAHNVKVRSNIKKMDRLLGNNHLLGETDNFYKLMNHYLVGGADKPLIHIDWCCLCTTTGMYLLRASMSMQGRSIVIYEECHPKAKENNHAIHKAFLNQLKKTLPPTASPIIVTDAGFRAIWFEYVKKIGWDFVGIPQGQAAARSSKLGSQLSTVPSIWI